MKDRITIGRSSRRWFLRTHIYVCDRILFHSTSLSVRLQEFDLFRISAARFSTSSSSSGEITGRIDCGQLQTYPVRTKSIRSHSVRVNRSSTLLTFRFILAVLCESALRQAFPIKSARQFRSLPSSFD